MTSPQPPYGPPPPPANRGMSTGKKVGLGCGGCLGVLLFLFLLVGCVAVLGGDDLDSGASEPSATREEAGGETAGGSAAEEADEETAAAEEPAAEEAVEEQPAEEEPETPSGIGNGIHRVGEDIEPGTYTTDGPNPDGILPMCYYARLSGLSGELDDIIANNNIEGPGSVVVQEGDVALELSGDCEWTLE
ncbi:hypothetical protein [Nocardiopsis sp. HUAS JQ3]|uniref:hypothetical protein n=1 Tax=Nocardiopsis sp. HUAS JQ3 TaxID=3061629 RepID=UPI0023A9F0C2|nr:hypothetical protein [Nocardiopsis sp. HUAS JQ3]WDZ88872.1 hypothetical protein PV789_18105 [Nocardiopsis sp. HUAS JQ3]